jgi:hypothetical protein
MVKHQIHRGKDLGEGLLVLERGSLGPSTVTLMALLYVAICGGEELTVIVSVKLFPETRQSAVMNVSVKIFPETKQSAVMNISVKIFPETRQITVMNISVKIFPETRQCCIECQRENLY